MDSQPRDSSHPSNDSAVTFPPLDSLRLVDLIRSQTAPEERRQTLIARDGTPAEYKSFLSNFTEGTFMVHFGGSPSSESRTQRRGCDP